MDENGNTLRVEQVARVARTFGLTVEEVLAMDTDLLRQLASFTTVDLLLFRGSKREH